MRAFYYTMEDEFMRAKPVTAKITLVPGTIKYWFDVIVNIANEGSIYSSGTDGRLTGWIIIT